MSDAQDAWRAAESYELYMGRWSRLIAERFVEWLSPPVNVDWLEVGCGTGALTRTVLAKCDPASYLATDASAEFVAYLEKTVTDERLRCATAPAEDLPAADNSTDIVTSGLVMNFLPDRVATLRAMQRPLRPGGMVAFYVWDYPRGGMGMIDAFWKAAVALDPAAADLVEAQRFGFCNAGGLAGMCSAAGYNRIETAALEVTTTFADFDALWHPFTLGAGPAPAYCQRLSEPARAALKDRLAQDLGTSGPIALPARAWAVRAATN